jgi:hypothetical protein
MKFYIYEVPGHKNGCTTQLNKRSNQNLNKYGIMPILIETYNYPDEPEYWQIVGDREWELAEMNGYSKGPHYKHAREQRILGNLKATELNVQSIAGQLNKESGWISELGKTTTLDKNHQSNAGILAAKSKNHNTNQLYLCPDGVVKNKIWIKRYCTKNNLDVNLCTKLVSN